MLLITKIKYYLHIPMLLNNTSYEHYTCITFFRFCTIFIIKTSFRYRKLHFSFDKFKMLLITKIKCYLHILMLPKHTFSADFTCIIVFVFERLLTLKQVQILEISHDIFQRNRFPWLNFDATNTNKKIFCKYFTFSKILIIVSGYGYSKMKYVNKGSL